MKSTKFFLGLALICFIVLMGTCLLCVEHYYGINTTFKNEISLTYKIHADVLMLRRHEKDFLARHDTSYLDKFSNAYYVISHDLRELEQHHAISGTLEPTLLTLHQQLEDYVRRFNQIKEIQLNLGLTPEEGLYGKLRTNAHQIEEYLSTLSEPELVNAVLNVRRCEKDFMLRLQPRNEELWEESIHHLRQKTQKSGLKAAHNEMLVNYINAYEESAHEYIEPILKQGTIHHHGLITELSLMGNRFEQSLNIITQHLLALSKDAEHTAQFYTHLLMLIFGLGILCLCITPFFILKIKKDSVTAVQSS
jgi:methyl-accepting chemotaxis protein